MATAKKPATATKATKATKSIKPAKAAQAVKTTKASKPLHAAATTRNAAKSKAAPRAAVPALGPPKPIKVSFTKTALAAYVADQANVEPRTAKAVLAALEHTMLGSLHKKGMGEFTLPGLLKIVVQQMPAKKRRFGKDPFTGEERWFDAKPASVKVKIRAMKKMKDAAS